MVLDFHYVSRLGRRPLLGYLVFIREMMMNNFKSYADEHRIGPFDKSFSVVVGPNGSGKSNVIDAMLFVFGKGAKQNPGQLKVHFGGVIWKKQGGGKAIEVDKSDLLGLTWMKVLSSKELGVRTRDGLYYRFTGLRDQDVASLNTFFRSNFGTTPEEKQLSARGKNPGEVDLNGCSGSSVAQRTELSVFGRSLGGAVWAVLAKNNLDKEEVKEQINEDMGFGLSD